MTTKNITAAATPGVTITVEQIEDGGPGTLRPRETMYVAHGPDGHTWLLRRTTADAARREGLAYFLRTRVMHEGRWVLADEHGRPFADAQGNRLDVASAGGAS